MFHQFLLHLIKAKLEFIALAKIPAIAALIVLGTTGFVVSGTIQARGDDDGERTVNLTIKPLESKTCVDALIAQTETLLELDALAGDGQSQLGAILDEAQQKFDALVAAAPTKVITPDKEKDSDSDSDKEEEDDDDD